MPRSQQGLSTFRHKTVGWAGGANIRDAINFIAPDQMRINENIILSERGGGRKRLGCESHGTFGGSADRALSVYTFYRGPGVAPQVLMHTTAGILYYTNDPSANPVVWTNIATGLSGSAPMAFETFNNKVYMSNGVDAYCSWSGTAYATFASAPKGKYIRLWKDTMWVSGVAGQEDRVYTSTAGDAETFPVAGYIDISRGDGDTMRALATDGNFLIVGKRDSTWAIYDPVTLANRVVDMEKGFESHFAVALFDGGLYFLTRRGIARYTGDAPSVIVSERFDPLFDPNLVQLDQLYKATAYAYEDRVGFALPERGQTYNSLIVEHYPRIAQGQFGSQGVAPFVFHRMPVQCFTNWRWLAEDQLFAGHASANKFMRVFAPVGTDDGVAFTAVMNTPFFDFGDQFDTKYLRRLRFLCAGLFTVLIYRNYDGVIYREILVDATIRRDYWNVAADVWGVGEWDFESLIQDLPFNVDAYGRCFSFQFRDAEAGVSQKSVWVGARNREVTAGEWAIYGMYSEGVVLGRRS